jgi:hypothetical protein
MEEKMKKITTTQIISIFFTLLTITVNALANILPINGQGTGEISDRFDVLFVPAGYVFSIWGVIYLGLIAYTIYQALPAQADNQTLNKIAPFYWLSSAANTAWIFLWHYNIFEWTLPAMLLILGSLIVIYTRIKSSTDFNGGEKLWLVTVPFSVYLGWISVATIANVSQLLFYLGWAGWGIAPELWTLIMLLVAAGLGVAMALRFSAVAYGLVLVWAFYGIAYKQADIAQVANTAYVGIGLVMLGILLALFKKLRKPSAA